MPNGQRKSSPAPDGVPPLPGETDPVRHLTRQLRTLEPATPLAVAVSGGGDSVALAHLMVEVAPQLNIPLTDIRTVTVDHGLRPDSAHEAEITGRWMQALGLSHDILTWKGGTPAPGLQAAAREARYGLLLDWCEQQGLRSLLTAHTADDQAETVLMRLARGSGVDGLSGMAPVRTLEAADGTRLRLLRPLLNVSRQALRRYLQDRAVPWLEDPANENPAFDRVKARHALALLEPLGLTRDRLAKTAAQLARARTALEEMARAAEARIVTPHPAGFAWLDPATLSGLSREVALRVLARVLMSVSGSPYRPRLDRLERVLEALISEGGRRARTLGGCKLMPRPDGRVLVCRELRAVAAPVAIGPGGSVIWDGRFRVRLATELEGGEIGAPGTKGLRQLRARKGYRTADIPPSARFVLPCFFRDGEAVAAPHLGVGLNGLEVEWINRADGNLLRFVKPH